MSSTYKNRYKIYYNKLKDLDIADKKWKKKSVISISKYANEKYNLSKSKLFEKDKGTIFKKIYNKCKKSAITIQAIMKGYLIRKHLDLYFRTMDGKSFYNDRSLLLEEFVQNKFYYSFPNFFENKPYQFRKNYQFDIRELYKIIKTTKINPYSQTKIPIFIQNNVKRIMKLYKISEYIYSEIPEESTYSSKVATFYQLLSDNSYPNMQSIDKFDTYYTKQILFELRTHTLFYPYITNLHISKMRTISILKKLKEHVLDVLINILKVNDSNRTTRIILINNKLDDFYADITENEYNSEDEMEAQIRPYDPPFSNEIPPIVREILQASGSNNPLFINSTRTRTQFEPTRPRANAVTSPIETEISSPFDAVSASAGFDNQTIGSRILSIINRRLQNNGAAAPRVLEGDLLGINNPTAETEHPDEYEDEYEDEDEMEEHIDFNEIL